MRRDRLCVVDALGARKTFASDLRTIVPLVLLVCDFFHAAAGIDSPVFWQPFPVFLREHKCKGPRRRSGGAFVGKREAFS